jgi:hypothetical protein
MSRSDDAHPPRATEDDANESQGLLRRTERDEDGLDNDGYSGSDDVTQRPGFFVWALTATAALSGLLFGYE